MTTQIGFPRELLKQSREERQKYFKTHWVAHTLIKDAAELVIDFIQEPAGAEVIYLIGPTGAGKTTLLLYVLKRILDEALPEMNKNPGLIPAIYMPALNPQNGVYDWKEHCIRILLALKEILIESKVNLPEPGSDRIIPDEIRKSRGSSAALRRSAEMSLYHRETKIVMIDDAHYITKRRSGEQLINQSDTIKSFSEQSHALHLLGGTYDLLPLRNLNGQLGRRSVTIHLRNYKSQNTADIRSFITALKTFQLHLPLDETPDFTAHWEEIYERSMGLVGVLKDWFSRSLHQALKYNKGILSFDLFLKQALPFAVCIQIAQEIMDGERALHEGEDELSRELLRARLEIIGESRDAAKPDSRIKKETNVAGNDSANSAPATKVKKRGRPGSKARRYPVGVDHVGNLVA